MFELSRSQIAAPRTQITGQNTLHFLTKLQTEIFFHFVVDDDESDIPTPSGIEEHITARRKLHVIVPENIMARSQNQ